jgi:hypothetical protein
VPPLPAYSQPLPQASKADKNQDDRYVTTGTGETFVASLPPPRQPADFRPESVIAHHSAMTSNPPRQPLKPLRSEQETAAFQLTMLRLVYNLVRMTKLEPARRQAVQSPASASSLRWLATAEPRDPLKELGGEKGTFHACSARNLRPVIW